MSEQVLDAPTHDELAMWVHASAVSAVIMYARRHGLDWKDEDQQERIKAVFREARNA